MFPVVKNNTLVALNGTNGLNGWFGRLVRRVIDLAIGAVGEVPIIGGMIQKELTTVVDKWTTGSEFFSKSGKPNTASTEFEPNAVETTIIENWSTSKMIPFYKVLTNQVSAAFANNNFEIQLSEINNAWMKMCVLKKYFATNEIAGLSADAVMSRMEIINGIFLPLENIILTSLAQYSSVISQQESSFTVSSANSSQFKKIANLSIGSTYSCFQFIDTNVKNNAPGVIISPTVSVPGTTPPRNQTPGTTTPTTPATTTKKPLLSAKNILFGLVLLWGGYELTKDNKKKK